jgi:hypothetical protein
MIRASHLAGWLGAWFVMGTLGSSAQAGKIHFTVAELPGIDVHGDSYVIAIDESRTDLIDHARALIDWVESGGDEATSPGGTILVAPIAPGSDGINRNILAAGEPLWSWHVVGDPEFADSTIEILDGWPTFVESDVPGWIANTNGNIGFWNYTIVAEIGTFVPEPSSIVLVVASAVVLAVGIACRRWSARTAAATS